MRRRLLLLLVVFGSCLAIAAQPQRDAKSMIPKDFDPWNIQRQFDIKILQDLIPQNAKTSKVKRGTGAKKVIRRADEAKVDTVSYFAVAQSYYKNYSFTYEGGDIQTYNIGVAVDGTKVTLTNLFNLYNADDSSPSYDYPVSGTYDAAAKTITIPTSTVFANATICGILSNYYTGVLMSGEVNKEGKMSPDDNLVFHVDGDFDRIYTNQSFGVANYTQDGSTSYGFNKVYRSFAVNLPKAGANLIKFNDIIEYGETFPKTPVTKTVTVVNTGSDATDYVTTVEADDNAFTTTTESGTIAGQSATELSFTLNSANIGEYEGLATVEYEGGEPLLVQMVGSVKDFPDFSKIVKNGDIKFTTNIEYPFEPATLDNGQNVARTTTNGTGNSSSKLTATFTVPEGQLGKLSWKGVSNNKHYWYSAAGGVFVDDLNTAKYVWQGANEDISKTEEFAPGEHSVRFQFDQSSYTGDAEEGLYVYDLDLQTTTLKADSAEITTPEVNLGNVLLEKGATASIDGSIVIQNKGKNNLKVTAITSDNKEFEGIVTTDAAEILKDLTIPVRFSTSVAGEKTAKLTITTTAGTFTATVKANAIAMPDYSQIVTEGLDYLTFTANTEHPFIVEDGKAYNANSGVVDKEASKSSFKISFTIPEGKLGYISWDGYSWGTPETVENYYAYDYSMYEIVHPMVSGSTQAYGVRDAGSESVFTSDDYWCDYVACIPGDHSITFSYFQGGDSVFYGKDRLEISNFKLHVIDYLEHNVELLTDSAVFDSTYIGQNRYTTATVKLHNTGSSDLEVTKIDQAGAFYGVVPTETAKFNKNLDVTLWFYPTEDGDFKDTITISTNAGDIKVPCHGKTKNGKGILLAGDFEDAATGWGTIDANRDGETWDLGSNLWGDEPRYVHGGKDCLASISYSNSLGSITPDNWTVSPAVTIPENGAKLSYYIAAFHPERFAEHYSLYITTDASTVDKIKETTPVTEETIETPADQDEAKGYVGGWELREVDLTPYAGKTIYLAFRHYDCTGQYILRLDDVFIYTNESVLTGIKNTTTGTENAKIERQEIFDLSGAKLTKLNKGINIIRTYYSDGSVKASKFINK